MTAVRIMKKGRKMRPFFGLAETVGFEPTVPGGTTDFEFYKVRVRISQFRVSFC